MSCRCPTNDCGTGIDSDAASIWKNNGAAISNPLWIHRAVTRVQARTVPASAIAGPAALPINGDACEDGPLDCDGMGGADPKDNKRN
jgi:hypothetical protein